MFMSYLLWLQTAYAIWQFFRYTKFLRLPYVIVSSVWNSGFAKSWFQTRKFLWVEGQPEFNTQRRQCNVDGEKIRRLYDWHKEGDAKTFKVVKKVYAYNVDNKESLELAKLLSYYHEYPLVYKLLPIYKDIFVLKCLPLDKALDMITAEGAKVHIKEEYSLLDETTEDYINENFMRIMSIFPLSLQAKGFDVLSTYLSVALLVLDTLSVPANKLWSHFSRLFIRYTKLTLAHFPERMRVPVHYVLSTGSDEFMFSDKYQRKTYWSPPGDYLVKRGNSITGWTLKDSLDGRLPVTDSNARGQFRIANQLIQYEILEGFDQVRSSKKYQVNFETPFGAITVNTYSEKIVSTLLYKMTTINGLPSPPVEKLKGRVVYFTGIESLLNEIEHNKNNYKLYSSPQNMIYCS